MKLTDEQIESLAGFVLEIMEDWPEFGTIDGFDLQDIAERNKILVGQTVHEPCGEECNCAEFNDDEDWKRGTTCYHMADWLVRDAQQRTEAERAGAEETASEVRTED